MSIDEGNDDDDSSPKGNCELQAMSNSQNEVTLTNRLEESVVVISQSQDDNTSISSPELSPALSLCHYSSNTHTSESPSDSESSSRQEVPHVMQTTAKIKTFKLVGDNIDKNVKPHDMRHDNQTKSLHYFHTYALRDRIDLSRYDDIPCLPDMSLVKSQLSNVLPNNEDVRILCGNFCHLVARVLKKYMPFFSSLGASLEEHIVHKFQNEMSQKSEVVSFI